MIDKGHRNISLKCQCELLGICRSSVYYKAKSVDDEEIELMSLVDGIYTKSPYMGSRKIAKRISRDLDRPINRKRISRIMQELGISPIYPKPRTSIPNIAHKKYPYLMGEVDITGPNQAWCTDITYVRLERGFAYLVAVMDWYSRRVLSWRLSNTMDTNFCVEALKEALADGKPEIFNSDQGSQFTSEDFTQELANRGITISMDGRGRVYDNIFIERLWRSVKYENIYPKGYRTLAEARAGLAIYFDEYNRDRPHQALSYRTPEEVHYALAA